MTPRILREATLVVIEYGACWPAWLPPTRYAQTAVVTQHHQGDPGCLLTQVALRIQRLERENWRTKAVILACNCHIDERTQTERALLSRGLLAKLSETRPSELVLSVEDDPRSSVPLMHLASALTPEATRLKVQIHVYRGRALDSDVSCPMLRWSA